MGVGGDPASGVNVVWAGTFDPGFSRNRKLARLLALGGHRVTVVREDLWPADRVGLASKGWARVLAAAVWRYPRLLARVLMTPAPDLYLVSYPGWFDMPVLRIAARLRGRPIVFDPFISLHDTMISDRGIHPEGSWLGRVASFVDRLSMRLADLLLADTPPHLDLYDTFAPGVRERGAVIPLGADDGVFHPRDEVAIEPRLVAFHGTFVPLQGLATIMTAVEILSAEGIEFVIVGDGQDRAVVETSPAAKADKVSLPGLLPLEDLPPLLARATVCLGIFGPSEKASRVVPHKLYECIAIGRPVITRDGPAIDSLFAPGEVITVPPGDAGKLAEAIRRLVDRPDEREKVARAGAEAYRNRFHESELSRLLTDALETALH